MKRIIEQSKAAVPAEKFELIYENYKEPLKKVPKAKGFGYYGTLAITADHQLVQCHICGYLFASVTLHLRKHKINSFDYKEKFGLSKGTALIGEGTREAMQQGALENGRTGGGLPEHLEGYNERRKSGELPVRGHKLSLESRNKKGVCPDQLLEKITELKDKLGHTPSFDDFRREYKGRYNGAITTVFGGYINAVREAKLTPQRDIWHPSKERLIETLQKFHVQHRRIPMTSDFNRGLLYPRSMYWRVFGSINNARVEAGLNAVLPLGFGQLKEVTPDEYLEYQSNHA